MKAILISIQPKWCAEISTLKKKVEIRKTKPTGNVPFKCYIYCTKAKEHFSIGGGVYATSDTLYRLPTGEIKFGDGFELMGDWSGQYDESNFLNGKVIGEFVCDEITPLFNVATTSWSLLAGNVHEYAKSLVRMARLTEEEMHSYAKRKNCYAWRISNLVIYDKPRSLGEFYNKCKNMHCEGCEHLKYQQVNSDERDYDCEYLGGNIPLSRAPQSWCYVEELM